MKKTPAFVAVFLAGCATKPESIAPAYVSEMTYSPYTCQQLGEEQARLGAALATASDAQRHARSNDIAGVILLGLPVSSLSGSNQASQIARLKGELEASQKAAIIKSCGDRPAIVPVVERAAVPELSQPAAAATKDVNPWCAGEFAKRAECGPGP